MVKPGDEDGFQGMTQSVAPLSAGYLLVDSTLCSGCRNCMLACSLVHEGVENLTLSRIQVIQNPFESFPDDVTIEQCRQCVDPACVKACPVDALKANAKYGNVRMVDRTKCIGCGDCVEACPYMPSRAVISELLVKVFLIFQVRVGGICHFMFLTAR